MRDYTVGYLCKCCGEYHEELPMSYGSSVPDYFYDVPTEEQEIRIELNDDLCVIDDEYFFIHGSIEIPIINSSKPFIWDVWVSLSAENFDKTNEYWEVEGREKQIDSMFGWLSTSVPGYPETIELKTMVHTRSIGERPYIELEPTKHPLAKEQMEGITMDRVKEIAEKLCEQDEQK